MSTRSKLPLRFQPNLSFVLLFLFLGTLLLAGGSVRGDVMGQAVVRAAAWSVVILLLVFGRRPDFTQARPVLWLLLATILLVALQLVPLPPAWWQALPGRRLLAEAAPLSGQAQPWRPLAIVPEATINALSSLIVPLAMLLLLAGLHERERHRLPVILLGLILLAMLLGLMQLSGVTFDNPLINNDKRWINGPFANRNHFALLLACGIVLVPVWALHSHHHGPRWRGPVAFCLILLLALLILATGSRAGTTCGSIAIVIAIALCWRTLRRGPRWLGPALILGTLLLIAIFVWIAITLDRAESINRALALDPSQDMRRRGLPVVLSLICSYFPWGSGFGGFDPIFRIAEPFELLKMSYFNHAHDDFLEIALDGGLPGVILLAVGILWWLVASFRVWFAVDREIRLSARSGSAIILLTLIASIFDYPARTPLVMTLLVAAGLWLSRGHGRITPSILPPENPVNQ